MVEGYFRSPNSDLVRAISLLLGSRSCRLTTSLKLSCTVEVAHVQALTRYCSMAWWWACMSGRWTPGGASTTWRTGRVARQIQVITDRISQYNTLLSNIHLEIQNLVTDHLSCKARCIGRLPPRDWWTFLLMFTLRTRVGSGSQGSSGVNLEVRTVSRCVEEGCEGHPCCTWAQYHTWAQEWW